MATRKKKFEEVAAAVEEESVSVTPQPATESIVWRCRDCNGLNDDVYGACVFCGESRP